MSENLRIDRPGVKFYIKSYNIMIFILTKGVIHKDHCTKQPFIPIYLIVIGSSKIFQQIITWIYVALSNDNDNEERNITCNCCECFISTLSLFTFGWFIAGNIWIYSAFEPNYYDTSHVDYCHKTLYLYAFWMTTALYILVAMFLCCTFCMACCSTCLSFKE